MRLSLEEKEHFFHELDSLIRSGRTLREAFDSLARGRGKIGAFAARVSGFEEMDGLLEQGGEVFTSLDRAALRSGARAGRLDRVSVELSQYYGMLAKARTRVRRHLAYPVFILHFAAVVLSVPYLFGDEGVAGFVRGVVVTLVAFYVAGGVLAAFWFGSIALARRSPGFEEFLLQFPLLGQLWKEMCGGRFAMTLSLAVGSGIGVLSALPEAGVVSGSAGLEKWSRLTVDRVRGGDTLSDALSDCVFLPEEVDRALRNGELAGRLDEQLARAADRLIERTDLRLESLSTWFPRLTYVAILVVVGLRVITFAQGILGMYENLLNL